MHAPSIRSTFASTACTLVERFLLTAAVRADSRSAQDPASLWQNPLKSWPRQGWKRRMPLQEATAPTSRSSLSHTNTMTPTRALHLPATAIACLLLPLAAVAQNPQPTFLTNAGQWPTEMRARAEVGGSTAWFHAEGVALQLHRLADHQPTNAGSIGGPALQSVETTVHMRFGGGGRWTMPVAEGEASTAPRWLRRGANGAPEVLLPEAREALRYPSVWPGVDAVFRGRDGLVAYDFEVTAGFSATTIEFDCEGLSAPLETAADGSLLMTTEFGIVRHTAPKSFELAADGSRIEVPSAFEVRGKHRFGFTVDRLDASRRLWIDPGIDWSTFFGGPDGATLRFNRHVDDSLFVLTGQSLNAIPAPWGTASPAVRGVHTTLVDTGGGAAGAIWTVMLTGSNDQLVLDMDFDASTGLTTVVGITDSPDLPVTANAFQPTFAGIYDGFLMQLDLGGNVVYLSYYGGAGNDRICDVAAHDGVVTVVGTTDSSTLPMAGASYQPVLGGLSDAFVAQFDPALPVANQLVQSTFVGNSTNQGIAYVTGSYIKNFDGKQVHVADNGEVTIAIQTFSSGPPMPTTANAFQNSFSNFNDVWVGRFDAQLTTLLAATYVGGNGFDVPTCMAVDAAGRVTLGIVHRSSNLPVTPGAFDTNWAANSNDSFLCRVDLSQSGQAQILYGSYLGGGDVDETNSVVLDPSSSIATFVGQTRQAGFGIAATAGALQATPQATTTNITAGFVLRVAMDGNGLDDVHYASYLLPGGSAHPWGVSQDPAGRAMITGITRVPTITSTTTGPQSAYAASATGKANGFAVLMDLLPTGVNAIGAASPSCAAPAYMQVNSQPNAGNATFELLCENAPAGAVGICALGAPLPTGIAVLGIDAYVAPSLTLTVFANANGYASVPLPIPAGLQGPYGLAAQFAWLPTTSCGGNVLTASNALGF